MSDVLHQPYRNGLIPGLKEVLSMDRREGLLGIAPSGAGLWVIAFADSQEEEIDRAIREIFEKHGLPSQVYLLFGPRPRYKRKIFENARKGSLSWIKTLTDAE